MHYTFYQNIYMLKYIFFKCVKIFAKQLVLIFELGRALAPRLFYIMSNTDLQISVFFLKDLQFYNYKFRRSYVDKMVPKNSQNLQNLKPKVKLSTQNLIIARTINALSML